MCSAPVRTGGYTKEKYGYQGTKVSGNTASRAPLSEASAMLPRTLVSVRPGVSRSGAMCSAATPMLVLSAISRLRHRPPPHGGEWKGGANRPGADSHRPGVNHESVVLAVQKNEIEHIERIDRPDSRNKRWLAVTVKRLQRKAARIDLAAFTHELGQLIVEVLVARKGFVAQFRKAALDAERHAGSIEEDRGREALALEAQRLKHVHETNRALEGDGVKGNEGLLARLGFDVLEHLLFIVDQVVALLMSGCGDGRHVLLLARELAKQTPSSPGKGGKGNSRKIAKDVPMAGLHIHSSIPFILRSIIQSNRSKCA